jgi:DNA-binding SARP family transcriptional activator/tetratricopeptide (TPR) repeat protein
MAAGMEFCLLGPLVVRRGGVELPVPRGKQRAVLAALLLNPGHVVSMDELAEILWGPAPPPSARVTVQNHVKRLRQALGGTGGSRISTRPHGYVIRVDPGELDVTDFEIRLAAARTAAQASSWDTAAAEGSAALTLWRGEPLADVESELLAVRDASRLAELRLLALETRIDADVHRGRHSEVIGELRQLVAASPLRERLHALLMLALHRDGRQAEALAAYHAARQVLLTELGIEPGPGLRKLHQQILTADPALDLPESGFPEPGRPAGGGPERVVPRELPAAVTHFTGRAEELTALTGLLDRAGGKSPRTAVISAIEGTAGVGKTALAVHWAHQVADRFPDGQLYVNLRGFDPGGPPVPPAEAVRGFIDRLRDPEQPVPAAPDAQAALYRSLLAGRRMLILLDNARDEEQVRPLLPGGPDCVTVITSRNLLTELVVTTGAWPMSLDTLTHDESTDLLARRLGPERVTSEAGTVRELVAGCAGLPLALCIIAARAAARPDLPLAILAAQLRDNGLGALSDADQRADLRAVFSWSYRHLDSAAARLFRLLGLHPGPDICAPAAASLTGMTGPEARAALITLTRAHLLAEPVPGRFTFHDLLRAYAVERTREQDAEAERGQALTRLLGWYLHAVAAADRALDYRDPRAAPDPRYRPPEVTEFASHHEADMWLAAEHANVVEAVRSAEDHGLDTIAWQLATFSWNYFYRHGYLDDWLSTHQIALRAARRSGDLDGQRRVLNLLGLYYRQRNDVNAAIDCYQQSLSIARMEADQRKQCAILDNLAMAYSLAGRDRDALRCFDDALRLLERAGDRSGITIALNNLGEVYRRLGRADDAFGCLQRASAIAQELGDPSLGYILTTLGELHLGLGHYRDAVTCCQRGLGVARQTGNRQLIAVLQAALGTALAATGEADAARAAWHEAHALYQELGLSQAAADIRARFDSAVPA